MENEVKNQDWLEKQTNLSKKNQSFYVKPKKTYYTTKLYLILNSETHSHKLKIIRNREYANGVRKSELVGMAKRRYNGTWEVTGISDNTLIKEGYISGRNITEKGKKFFQLDNLA